MSWRTFKIMMESRKGFTDSDMVALGIGILLGLSSILMIINFLKLNSLFLLLLGIFALIFGIASTLKNRIKRNTLILSSFITPFIIGVILRDQDLNLDNLNNGISLFALSYTVIILPFSRTRQEKEQKEVDDLIQQIQDKDKKIANHDKDIFERLKEITSENIAKEKEIIRNKDERIKDIQEDKNSQIEALKENLISQKKYFEDKNDEITKKFRNEILTLNQKNSAAIELLETAVKVEQKKVKILDKRNIDLKIENKKLTERNLDLANTFSSNGQVQFELDTNLSTELNKSLSKINTTSMPLPRGVKKDETKENLQQSVNPSVTPLEEIKRIIEKDKNLKEQLIKARESQEKFQKVIDDDRYSRERLENFHKENKKLQEYINKMKT